MISHFVLNPLKLLPQKTKIVSLLGGFHMLMSFYESIGMIMSGSGIERVFQLISIAADTDLLIMFVYSWDSLMEQIIMRSEATKTHKAIERDIGVIAECIGDVLDIRPYFQWM